MAEHRDRADPDKLIRFSAEALRKLGVPVDDAEVTARMLVACDLRGVDSHGVAHLRMFYANRIRRGIINLDASPKLESRAPSTAVMDGDNGLGFAVGYRAMSEAIRRAGETGSGFVAVRNSTHFGAAAYYAMMALEHDMIGIAMTNAVPIVVSPASSVPVVGTNPISVAVPAGRRAPFVLDMATSAVAGGKLEIAARNEASTIPAGWLVDGEGNAVTELRGRRRGSGGLVPLGGAAVTGGYKGFGLALVVEFLCGVLSGSVASLLLEKPAEVRGNYCDHFFGALRIDGFVPVDRFKESMDDALNAIEALPPVPGVAQVTIPGPYEAGIESERRETGIPLHPKVMEDLRLLAEELEMDFDIRMP